ELYNLAVWPWHVLAIVLGLAVLVLWLLGGAWQGRTIAAVLATCWLFVAWAYFLAHYGTLTLAARYFAPVAASCLDRPYPQPAIAAPGPGRGRRSRALHLCPCALRLAVGRPGARSAVAAGGDLRHCAGSYRGGDARRSYCGRSHALGASPRPAALV